MPEIEFSQHAIDQMTDRGTTKEEIKSAILDGEQVPAKKGRKAYRKNIQFDSQWKGKYF